MTTTMTVDMALLSRLQPVGSLSPLRLRELASLCFVEPVNAGQNPFRIKGMEGQSIYLLDGDLELQFGEQHTIISAHAPEHPHPTPLARPGPMPSSVRAVSDVRLLRIDDDLLDILMTWDQLSSETRTEHAASTPPRHGTDTEWFFRSNMFTATNLKFGAISRLPAARVSELLSRMEQMPVRKGQVIIVEGDVGDYYYLIESGIARVTRRVGGVDMELAELKAGDAFGEEALISESRRNATVIMSSEGRLLRLAKPDFVELLKEPLLNRLGEQEALRRVAAGAVWLDVRYPSEFQAERLPGAINIPLSEIRNAIGVLDMQREYLVYCQSGRRSSVAAFILAQRGYKAAMLGGGLWGSPEISRLTIATVT